MSANRVALYLIGADGCAGGCPVQVAVAPIGLGPTPVVNPARPRAELLHLDEPAERARVQEFLDFGSVVFEDSVRDTAALLRAGLRVPDRFDDLRIAVHEIDERRSWSHKETGVWQNGVAALAHDLLGDTALLPTKVIRKLHADPYRQGQQARLHADYLATLFVKYEAQVAQDTEARKLYEFIDLKFVGIVREMQHYGVGCDVTGAMAYATEVRRNLHADLQQLKTNMQHPEDVLDDNKLRHYVYEELRFAPLVFTDKGLPAVSEEALTALQDPEVDLIAEARHKDMLLMHLRDLVADRLHGEFHIAGSVSGRVYMRKPNLVGLPRDLRRFIVPAPGHVLIILDYSQVELRVLAKLSNDAALVRAFRTDEDLHRKMAALIHGIPPEAVTKQQRDSEGKKTNFAVVYGQTPVGLAAALKVSPQAGLHMIKLHQKTYPRVWRWREEKLAEARAAGGLLRTWLGRKRHLPSICHGSSKAARRLINHQVQSVAADIAKSRLTQIVDAVRDRAWPVLFAHDEYVLECLPEHAADVLATAVGIAERDVKGFGVPLRVKSGMAQSWAEKP